jgi:hypothetical protein
MVGYTFTRGVSSESPDRETALRTEGIRRMAVDTFCDGIPRRLITTDHPGDPARSPDDQLL